LREYQPVRKLAVAAAAAGLIVAVAAAAPLAGSGRGVLAALKVGEPEPALTRLDPATHLRTVVAGLRDSTGFAAIGRSIWVSSIRDPWLRRVDVASGRVVGRIRMRQLVLPLDPGRPPDDYWNSTLLDAFGSYWATIWPGQGGLNDASVGSLVRLGKPS
jgi:hypothetical protein